jgi:hypothetical protein
MGAVMPAREVLGNELDDDCDGTVDEADGICIPSDLGEECGNGRDDDCDTLVDCDDPGCAADSACPDVCRASEFACFGGRDDDCDGATDCDDAECFERPECDNRLCSGGRTPTFHRRTPSGPGWGVPSAILEGDLQPIMPMTCEDGGCDAGLVNVEVADGSWACLPPPAECPEGQHATYVGGAELWRCDGVCEWIIHYGGIYDYVNRCASRTELTCPGGQTPTFVLETEEWSCRPTCDNGLYDQRFVDGVMFCIPC